MQSPQWLLPNQVPEALDSRELVLLAGLGRFRLVQGGGDSYSAQNPNPAPGGPQAPTDPSNPGAPADPWGLGQFNNALPGVNAGIAANQTRVGGIADQLQALGSPGAWGNFTQQQLGQFDVLGNQRQQAALGSLAKSGITGTGAANMQDQMAVQTNAQRQALSGQLGQQGLQFQGGLLGAQAGMLSQQNQMGNDQLQNLLAGPAINVAGQAAQNAGNTPGGKYGGGGKK